MARGNGELPVRCFYCFVFPFLNEQQGTPKMRTPQARERARTASAAITGLGAPPAGTVGPAPGSLCPPRCPSPARSGAGLPRGQIGRSRSLTSHTAVSVHQVGKRNARPATGKIFNGRDVESLPAKHGLLLAGADGYKPARAQQLLTGLEKHNAVIKAEF